ncbi:LysR substrate-binding domain-containing protein [Prosthecomicrobium sp. N25]|uniref:LysR substrate-binding domain-containing protein n=1 Tax=Prosthecomicrobium sp. N25 TaxID=3129254 RepID=UPI0030784221
MPPITSRRLTPSIGALQAFEAAARLSSFSDAARELSLTQAAVSRQIAQLEDQLGLKLFERVRQRVQPTAAGRFYAGEVGDILSRLASATAKTIAFRDTGGSLDLAVLPSFATRWLIPRMAGFFARHRDVMVNFATRVRPVDFRRERLDAAIMHGTPSGAGLEWHLLLRETLIVVASPAMVAREQIATAGDLARVPLLVQETRPEAWDRWFAAAGVAPARRPAYLAFEQFLLVIRAAVAGLGVALVPDFLARDEIASGELVRLDVPPLDGAGGYYLVFPTENAQSPPLQAFKGWLVGIAAGESGETLS